MTRNEQIQQAAAAERSISEERAFIRGAKFADETREFDKIVEYTYECAQNRLITKVVDFLIHKWGINPHDVEYLKDTVLKKEVAETAKSFDALMGEPLKDVDNLINSLHQ